MTKEMKWQTSVVCGVSCRWY